MKKERIHLTDITLHTRALRPTPSFAQVAQKGRVYATLLKKPVTEKRAADDSDFTMVLHIPPDIQERLDRGEIELVLPQGGLPMLAGSDMQEKMKQMNRKERRKLIHSNRGRTWHSK